MTVREALDQSGLDKADAEILLASLLKHERSWLFAHADEEMPSSFLKTWDQWTDRRRGGEPVAYITGTKEFFGHPFHVTPAVLIPRPATETLVEIALKTLHSSEPQQFVREIDSGIAALVDVWSAGTDTRMVADIGTGSGCIGITLALERPDLSLIATDTSPEALLIARENAVSLGARRIDFRLGDALDPLADVTEPFLLVSNPPYIPAGTPLERDVASFEPHEALFAGSDGMDVIRRMVTQANTHPQCVGYVMECRMEQAKALIA